MQTTQMQTDFSANSQVDLIAGNDRYADDHKLYPHFFMKTVQDVIETEKQKRPIFKEVEYLRVMVPGDRGLQVFSVVDELAKQRFPRAYQAFKAGTADQTAGTPLEALPGITPSRAEEYRHIGIKTIELLASASDSNAFMGFQSDKQKAIQYLAIAEGKSIEAVDKKLSAENEAMKQTIADMQAKLEKMVKAKSGA